MVRYAAKVFASLFVAAAVAGFYSSPATATPASADTQLETMRDVSDDAEFGLRSGSFIVAPIPFSNPTIGAGLVLGGGYLFNLDEGSKPSVIGIAALASDNGSKAYGMTLNLYFDNNRWLFESMFGKADIHYDLYTPIGTLPIKQDGVLGRVSLSYGVTSELSFGGALRYLDTTINLDAPGLPPIPPPYNNFLNTKFLNVGVIADWDRRDDSIFPTTGLRLQFEATRGLSQNGIFNDYNKTFLNYTHYQPVGPNGVVVGRASTCATSSDAPFFDQCSLGGSDRFRGFSVTQFLDLRSVSIQAEYRHKFSYRFGGVLFAGVGMVGPHYDELDVGGTHGAAGIGLRYRVSKKYPLDMSMDITRNTLRENQLYIYVGQRF